MVTTITFMYEPDIHINEDMMATLTLKEIQSWVESSPTKVLDIDHNTQQVLVLLPNGVIGVNKNMLRFIFSNLVLYDSSHEKIKLVPVVDPEAYTYDDEVIKKAEAMGKLGIVVTQ